MSDLTIERTFSADPAKVFAYVTKTEHLLTWWGPEGMHVSDHNLDLSKPAPWYATLVNADGGLHKMSGEVVAVDPPHLVEFTWGWHDDEDMRGAETIVRFELSPDGRGGTRFRLIHRGFADDETAAHHTRGWTSTLVKLERLAV